MNKVKKSLFWLHLFVGVGALFGGGVTVINPIDPLGVPVSVMKNAPFSNFLIPGIILLVVLGMGNCFSALIMRADSKFQGYISSIFSWAVMIWIVVQCIMLESVAALHVIYFVVGLVMAVLSALLLLEQRLFPANIAIEIWERIKPPKETR